MVKTEDFLMEYDVFEESSGLPYQSEWLKERERKQLEKASFVIDIEEPGRSEILSMLPEDAADAMMVIVDMSWDELRKLKSGNVQERRAIISRAMSCPKKRVDGIFADKFGKDVKSIDDELNRVKTDIRKISTADLLKKLDSVNHRIYIYDCEQKKVKLSLEYEEKDDEVWAKIATDLREMKLVIEAELETRPEKCLVAK